VNPSSSLPNLLAQAFQRVDASGDGKLNREDFSSFYEVLKAGIAVDGEGTPQISETEYFERMDHNRDGVVEESEMQSTGVLMPAELTSGDSLNALIQHLLEQATKKSTEVAMLLSKDDDQDATSEPTDPLTASVNDPARGSVQ
jgi:Ca2+-binding EF-hand superfamily protein